ncbi:hypothetical protein L1049_002148 [Liquidambar formosana]|uniref:Cytochrome P450 n=1 Tax=Liquidambar formosana TaxID=63359 RepID=A0AAP0R823_LIQFO
MAMVGYVVLIAILCFLFFRHLRSNKNSPVTNWPLVGMLPALLSNAQRFHEFATHVLKRGGYTWEFKGPWFTKMDFLITSDVDNMRHILIKNFPNFQRGSAFKKIFDVLGEGILRAELDSWKIQRQLVHSLMKQGRFQRQLEKATQKKLGKGLFPVLEHVSKLGTEVDMHDLFSRFTFDNACMLMLGFDPNSLSVELPEVSSSRAIDEIEEALLYRHVVPEMCWKLQKWLQIGEEKKLSRARETFDRFVDQHVSLKRERWRSRTQKEEADEEESFDLVTGLMEEEKEIMGLFGTFDKFLRDEILNVFIAARDTVSVSLAWFFWCLSRNPSAEFNIREEMKARLQAKEDGKQRIFNLQEVNELVYLHGALCESLRLYPPIPIDHKAAVEADTLPSGHRTHNPKYYSKKTGGKARDLLLGTFEALQQLKRVAVDDQILKPTIHEPCKAHSTSSSLSMWVGRPTPLKGTRFSS